MPARLETYVEELRHELRDLPVASRAQELVEVRTHLEELKAANVELGLSEEEAEAAAVAQFGGSQSVGKAVKKTHWRDQWDSIPGAMWLSGWMSWLPVLALSRSKDIVAMPTTLQGMMTFHGVSLMMGILLSRLVPRYALRGSIFSFCFLALIDGVFWFTRDYAWSPSTIVWLPRVVFLLGILIGSLINVGRKRGVA